MSCFTVALALASLLLAAAPAAPAGDPFTDSQEYPTSFRTLLGR